jgi:uncharacterized protein (DUF2141 family)
MNRSCRVGLALALALSAAVAPAAIAADLTVTVKQVRDGAGSVRIVLYDSAASFLKPPLAKAAQQAKASSGEVRFVLHDLPAGTYAIGSFHDESNIGRIEFGPLGVPLQGYGFSNDALGTEGPPSFANAAFEFDGKTDKAISFSLNY